MLRKIEKFFVFVELLDHMVKTSKLGKVKGLKVIPGFMSLKSS